MTATQRTKSATRTRKRQAADEPTMHEQATGRTKLTGDAVKMVDETAGAVGKTAAGAVGGLIGVLTGGFAIAAGAGFVVGVAVGVAVGRFAAR